MDMNNGMNNMGQTPAPAPKNGTAALVLGIVGLVVSILGGICFGVIGALIGLACSIVAVVLSIGVKNATNNQKGGSAFVCGLLGIIFGAIFMVGCAIYGSCSAGYMCYGCVGGRCKASSDLNSAADDLNDILNSLE